MLEIGPPERIELKDVPNEIRTLMYDPKQIIDVSSKPRSFD